MGAQGQPAPACWSVPPYPDQGLCSNEECHFGVGMYLLAWSNIVREALCKHMLEKDRTNNSRAWRQLRLEHETDLGMKAKAES